MFALRYQIRTGTDVIGFVKLACVTSFDYQLQFSVIVNQQCLIAVWFKFILNADNLSGSTDVPSFTQICPIRYPHKWSKELRLVTTSTDLLVITDIVLNA